MTKAQAHDDPDAVAAQRERIRELEEEVAELSGRRTGSSTRGRFPAELDPSPPR